MANNDVSKVTINELRKVSSSLNTQRETIYNTYNNQIRSVLTSSNDFFQVSGVDFSSIESTFRQTFAKVNSEMNSLIEKLDSTINNYEQLTNILKQLFNKQLLSELNNLLK